MSIFISNKNPKIKTYTTHHDTILFKWLREVNENIEFLDVHIQSKKNYTKKIFREPPLVFINTLASRIRKYSEMNYTKD